MDDKDHQNSDTQKQNNENVLYHASHFYFNIFKANINRRDSSNLKLSKNAETDIK